MAFDKEEVRLEEFFSALKEEDSRQTPSFDSVLNREEELGARHGRPRNLFGLALSSALAIGLGLVALLNPGPSREGAGLEAVAVLDGSSFSWDSPTAFLLEYPGKHKLEVLPDLSEGGDSALAFLLQGNDGYMTPDLQGFELSSSYLWR